MVTVATFSFRSVTSERIRSALARNPAEGPPGDIRAARVWAGERAAATAALPGRRVVRAHPTVPQRDLWRVGSALAGLVLEAGPDVPQGRRAREKSAAAFVAGHPVGY